MNKFVFATALYICLLISTVSATKASYYGLLDLSFDGEPCEKNEQGFIKGDVIFNVKIEDGKDPNSKRAQFVYTWKGKRIEEFLEAKLKNQPAYLELKKEHNYDPECQINSYVAWLNKQNIQACHIQEWNSDCEAYFKKGDFGPPVLTFASCRPMRFYRREIKHLEREHKSVIVIPYGFKGQGRSELIVHTIQHEAMSERMQGFYLLDDQARLRDLKRVRWARIPKKLEPWAKCNTIPSNGYYHTIEPGDGRSLKLTGYQKLILDNSEGLMLTALDNLNKYYSFCNFWAQDSSYIYADGSGALYMTSLIGVSVEEQQLNSDGENVPYFINSDSEILMEMLTATPHAISFKGVVNYPFRKGFYKLNSSIHARKGIIQSWIEVPTHSTNVLTHLPYSAPLFSIDVTESLNSMSDVEFSEFLECLRHFNWVTPKTPNKLSVKFRFSDCSIENLMLVSSRLSQLIQSLPSIELDVDSDFFISSSDSYIWQLKTFKQYHERDYESCNWQVAGDLDTLLSLIQQNGDLEKLDFDIHPLATSKDFVARVATCMLDKPVMFSNGFMSHWLGCLPYTQLLDSLIGYKFPETPDLSSHPLKFLFEPKHADHEVCSRLCKILQYLPGIFLETNAQFYIESASNGVWMLKTREDFLLRGVDPNLSWKVAGGWDDLAYLIRQDTSLKRLDFGAERSLPESVLAALGEHQGVSEINLEALSLEESCGLSFYTLSSFIGKCSGLETLACKDIKLLPPLKGTGHLSDGLKSNSTSLVRIDFAGVTGLEKVGEAFVEAVKDLNNIQFISVIKSDLNNFQIVSLAQALEDKKHLTEVKMGMPYKILNCLESLSRSRYEIKMGNYYSAAKSIADPLSLFFVNDILQKQIPAFTEALRSLAMIKNLKKLTLQLSGLFKWKTWIMKSFYDNRPENSGKIEIIFE